MSIDVWYPEDLANAVFAAIKRQASTYPDLHILVHLFESMYFASLETEESVSIKFHLVYLDPGDPDPHPPKRRPKDRWSPISLASPIEFNIPNLIKVGSASDPRSSSLAVYHDDHNQLFIWGLIDQGNRYYDFVNYESDEGPERPGVFQASIEGTGHVVAYLGYEKIAELKKNKLVQSAVDVFHGGPVREALQPGINKYIKSVKTIIGEDYNNRKHWDTSLTSYWTSSLCRLLLRMRNYHHGGALLITANPPSRGLNVKYPIRYNRLGIALKSRASLTILRTLASDQIVKFLDEFTDEIPTDLYLDENVHGNDLSEVLSEIDGTIWFISLLSRVDGLILMTPNLNVLGFGVEITVSKSPEIVAVSTTRAVIESRQREVDYNHYGTRHRSMMRYCWKYPGSVGFVISQDRDVRVMTRVENKILIWDNIKLQLDDFVLRKFLSKRVKK